DLVLSEGGVEPERVSVVAESKALEKFFSDARDFRDGGLRLVGATAFDSVSVQQASESHVSFYVCDDVSQTDLVNASGTSLVKADRIARSPWQITAEMSGDHVLRISKKDLWAGENFC
ncbi:hypothetical protein, partial [Agreia sp.]|uniref:hypothetical protein n=1 Tax=Agreia sp. TaxID=1872416 RepID=UPI0035BC1286